MPSNEIDEETGDLKWLPEEEEEQDDEKESRHFIGYVRQLSALLASMSQQLIMAGCGRSRSCCTLASASCRSAMSMATFATCLPLASVNLTM